MEDEVAKWVKKVEDMKGKDVDLSRDEDLSVGIMNLISLEEHLFFTAMKTNNEKYLDTLNAIRQIRKKLLAKIVKDPKGEEWCISKHLLASSMRMMEVGTKELQKKNQQDANFFFEIAYELYSLFFAINLKMMDSKELKTDQTKFSKISQIVNKLIDCCKE